LLVKTVGILFIITGVLIFGGQIFAYLKSGEWHELPFLLLAIFGPDSFVSWLENPKSWIGFHKIVYWLLKVIPISLFLIVVGICMITYERQKENND